MIDKVKDNVHMADFF